MRQDDGKEEIMPDITMCKRYNCDKKHNCCRFTAKPDARQSYFAVAPMRDGKCNYFVEVVDDEFVKRKDEID